MLRSAGANMRIERHFTGAGDDAYRGIAFRSTTSEIRNPDGSRVFHLRRHRGAGRLEPGRLRHPRPEIFPQGGRAGEARAGAEAGRAGLAVAPHARTRRRSRELPPARAHRHRRRSAKQVFDRLAGTWTYWGWKGGYFDSEADARAFYDEMRYMLCRQMARAELAAVVQHRPALGLWHRRAGAGPLLRRLHRPAS